MLICRLNPRRHEEKKVIRRHEGGGGLIGPIPPSSIFKSIQPISDTVIGLIIKAE